MYSQPHLYPAMLQRLSAKSQFYAAGQTYLIQIVLVAV